MESFLETVDLDLEDPSELLFKVKVEGLDPAPAKVRLVCESGAVSFMFDGNKTSQEGVVQFLVPVMKGKIEEGIYLSRVEVLVENRYFAPVQFQINFKKAVTVVAESIKVMKKTVSPEIKVTAQQINQPKPVVHSTLKERFLDKKTNQLDEDAVLEAARKFLSKNKK